MGTAWATKLAQTLLPPENPVMLNLMLSFLLLGVDPQAPDPSGKVSNFCAASSFKHYCQC
jgi:hypothetical protein